jgi:hypothetical protein
VTLAVSLNELAKKITHRNGILTSGATHVIFPYWSVDRS